jgi:hypothetical protein
MGLIFSSQLELMTMENDKSENQTQKETENLESLKMDLEKLTIQNGWNNQRVNKGTVVWATDRNGVVTAMTFIPD